MSQKITIDLEHGVLPISKAAGSLAALIRRCTATHQPIIVTQKGVPCLVIVSVARFDALRAAAAAYLATQDTPEHEDLHG